ncbi:MAG: hypothetical protein AB1798_16070 [Spirochaetota bacterium]
MKQAFKTWVALIIVFLIYIAGIFPAEQATIKEMSGKVTYQPPGRNWMDAKPGTTITEGTIISTGFDSSAILDLSTSEITVKALTRMKLEELIKSDTTASTSLNLQVGRVKAKVKTVEGITHDFKLKSSISTAAVRGTEFEYDGETIKGLSGTVTFSNIIGQTRKVGAGEASATTGVSLPVPVEESKKKQSDVSPYTTTPSTPAGGGGIVQTSVTSYIEEAAGTPPTTPPATTSDVTITITWP